MMPQATGGDVQDHKQHGKADGVNPNHTHPAGRAGRKYRLAHKGGVSAGTGGQVRLRPLPPTVSGHAPRLEHR